tara:strand:- start:260 stop:655 length:396 start_codon:yes stop_codon:yes gene_type:complete
MKKLVFVYGTLKFGFSNYRLLWDSKLIGRGITTKKFALYEAGIPFVMEHESDTEIYGEVYEVDEQTLAILDSLEGHPYMYERKRSNVRLINGENCMPWIYFYQGECKQLGMNKIINGVFKQDKKLWNNQSM